MSKPVLIEGYTPNEILNLPQAEVNSLLFTGGPLVFQVGSVEILGEFGIHEDRLVVQLAHVDGGGEGALPTLWLLAKRYARQHRLTEVEWVVYATDCAKPNLKLRQLLERRGFVVQDGPYGRAYYFLYGVASNRVEPGASDNSCS